MRGSLYETILGPLLARLGTLGAGFLVAAGANETLANQVMVGASAAVLIGIDLGIGYLNRRKAKEKVSK